MKENNLQKVVVVLSAGRSGTSLLMKTLGQFGMALSDSLIPGRLENPEGYFEDSEIVEVHKTLFNQIHAQPTLPLPDGWLEMAPTRSARQKLNAILNDRVDCSDKLWGFKDPRTASFLPLWTKVFNLSNIVPIFILAVRNPSAVSVSLRRQINRDESISELQWLQRTCDALSHTSSDCFILHYEDWFTRPVELAQELMEHTGLNSISQNNVSGMLKDLIKPNLNRSIYADYTIQNGQVSNLYELLTECRGNKFDRKKLMDGVQQCQKIMIGFKGWYLKANLLLEENETIKAKLSKRNIDTEEKETKNLELRGDLEKQKILLFEQKQAFDTKIEKLKNKNKSSLSNLSKAQETILFLKEEQVKYKELENDLESLSVLNTTHLQEIEQLKEAGLSKKEPDEYEAVARDLEKLNVSNARYLKEIEQLKKETGKYEAVKYDLEKLTFLNSDYLKKIQDYHEIVSDFKISKGALKQFDQMKVDLDKIRVQRKAFKDRLGRTKSDLAAFKKRLTKMEGINIILKSSYSLQLGQALINAVKRPGKNTILLPFKLFNLIYKSIFIRNRT